MCNVSNGAAVAESQFARRKRDLVVKALAEDVVETVGGHTGAWEGTKGWK